MSNHLSRFFILLSFSVLTDFGVYGQSEDLDLFEIKIYHFQNPAQEQQLDEFLEKAYLPALDRAGIPDVGVFKPVKKNAADGKKIYVLIPYPSVEQFSKVPEKLNQDEKFRAAGNEYLNAPHDNPPYDRIETILLQAFEGMPNYKANDLKGSNKVYELRSYEGATEKLLRKKVEMFNKGEIAIFQRLGFNPMFFGTVIAGSRMPNLMYMTAHVNMAARKAHWNAFKKDAEWGKMKIMEEYKHTVSHIDVVLLYPVAYSRL